jgi:CRISPR-associated endonuclease Cas2
MIKPMAKKKSPITFVEKMKKFSRAGIAGSKSPNRITGNLESNKVRNQIVKYLIKKGCTRVQKSIFLADLPTVVYDEIRNDLAAVQQCYDNEDSILIVPISTDYLRSMKVIGQTLDVDLILKTKNTLFF